MSSKKHIKVLPSPETAPCPICKNPSSVHGNSHFPFCSNKCGLLDLGNWFNGNYKIETTEKPEEDSSTDDHEFRG